MSKIWFRNEDCFKTIEAMERSNYKVDLVMTSPPYNTNKKAGKTRTLNTTSVKEGQYNYVRYDSFIDNFDEVGGYVNWSRNLFINMEKILNKNGVILYNMSYGSENTTDMFLVVADIIQNTNLTIQDCIVWKKSNALPNTCSSNKLTRIVEYVFVFCRKGEEKTFNSNKKVVSTRESGQKMYENIYNFIEAKNNDGSNNLNKATYSTDLCKKLLSIYAKEGSTVYDPFMGTGTTAIACEELGFNCVGSELSDAQVEYSKNRLEEFRQKRNNIED